MNAHSISPAFNMPAGSAEGKILSLNDRALYVAEFFPEYKKEIYKNGAAVEPPHADEYHRGLLELKLTQPQPSDSNKVRLEKMYANRKAVFDYTKDFSAGTDKRIYKRLADQAMAVVRSSEIVGVEAGAAGRAERETLAQALKATFTATFGINSMARTEFMSSMMLDSEEFELEKEW
jgi:hypothetical protein